MQLPAANLQLSCLVRYGTRVLKSVAWLCKMQYGDRVSKSEPQEYPSLRAMRSEARVLEEVDSRRVTDLRPHRVHKPSRTLYVE